MSMDPGRVTGVATGFIDALKSQPLSLALCVMNIALLAIMFYDNKGFAAARQESLTMILDYQKETQKLLAQCGTGGPRSDYAPSQEHTL
jgi:hypothetical protein